MLEFIVLGEVPGLNYQLDFNTVVLLAAGLVGVVQVHRIFRRHKAQSRALTDLDLAL